MNNMGFDQEDKKPLGSIRGSDKSQKLETEGTERIVNSLRAEMIQSSEALPEEENVTEKNNIKLAVGTVISVVIVIFILFIFTGSRRQMLAKGLNGFFNRGEMTPGAASETPIAMIISQPEYTQTQIPSATRLPTKTQAIMSATPPITPTQVRDNITATVTPTATSSWQCRDALSITLDDVGQNLCTYGTIIETVEKPNNFMVIFSQERGSFYWVTYDLVWSKGEVDDCYYATGKIDQIANSPMLVFGYTNLPERCP